MRVTPDPVAADAAPTAFSALRAEEHIERMARSGHASGSPQAAEVRSYVTDRLTSLGLTSEQRESTEVLPRRTASHLAGRVHNIIATISGRSSTGRVMLVAHTDSVVTGPGASDDGLGVASLLEIARVLKQGAQPRNDVVLLFTDAEEIGQLGARAFVRDLPKADRGRDVVVNLDARGTSGRVVMFETGAHSSAVVAALSDTPPVATSLSDEVYRLLPHETDFTHFRDAGLTGLNFAVIGGSARYHGPEDDIDHVDPGSLQDMGDTALSATRDLAAMDLKRVAEAPEATWFNVGPLIVRYPLGAVLPLAVATLAALAASVWYARRRQALRVRPAAFAALTFPLPLVAAAALGWAAWQVLLLVRPSYGLFHGGDPYRTGTAVAGLLLLTAAVTWLWIAWAGKRATALETTAGALVWPALVSLLSAVLLPGAAYVFTWIALGGAAGVAVAARLAERVPWRTVALAAPALPAVVLMVPLVALLFPALGLASAAVPLALAAVAAAVLLSPLTDAVRAVRLRHTLAIGLAAALVGATLVGVNAAIDGTDAEHPRPISLMYAMDVDQKRAYWVSEDADPDPWVTHYTGGRRDTGLEAWSPALAAPPGGLLAGEAPIAPGSRPAVRTLSDRRTGDTRTLRLSVRPESGTPVLLALYVDTSVTEVVGAKVTGGPADAGSLSGGVNRPHAGSPWKWGLVFAAPPVEGYQLTLTVRGDKPVRLLAMTEDAGLPEQVMDRPRPAELTWDADAAGMSFASRTYTL
ncbi:M20/M25/M40 family metallo-hydrolase [Streptomyces sp. NBC_00057]|uniref:M20/M25/M40 family metallo-hydrolase n=1 Tax=Streptomyces sp. NBC_00057 TaxID=2975634 RepID=UPI0032464AD3